ncbi:MAG: translation initiation factor IF-2 [Candidatus Omnitrophota bacterium]
MKSEESKSDKKKKPRTTASRTAKKRVAKKKQPQKPAPAKTVKPRKRAQRLKKQPVVELVKQEEAVRVVEQPAAPTKPAEIVPEPVAAEPVAARTASEKKPEAAPLPQAPAPHIAEEEGLAKNEVELEFPVSVKDLAVKLQVKPSRLIQESMRTRVFVTINQQLSQEDAAKVCEIFGYKIKLAPDKEEQILSLHRGDEDNRLLKPRSPVVTLMGHVDHGKTSLLDIIRKTNITDGEHGGITQHIGAYEVSLPKGKITFLDTPGHEAFTAMRAHGAHITDIVVLVVAADDGVMPQTIEAIDHAKAAGVPIVVAINKIDKPQVDIERVKKQLSNLGLTPEDWQGRTITVGVSAKTGEGVDELLEMILLEAEMLELKANYQKLASGVVIESRHDKDRGPIATLLVEKGTLHLNDIFISGLVYAKVKAMFNDRGKRIDEALPGTPVEVLGLTGLPEVGKEFYVVNDEKQAREIVALRQEKERKRQFQPVKRLSLEELHSEIKQGKIKELRLIIKSDVSGSLEAVRDSLQKLATSEVKFQIVHGGIGSINTSDVMLAKVTDALILGFHVQPDERAAAIIEREGIEVRTYNIIYELISEIKGALEGLLEPKIKKVFLGRAQVRKVFNLSRAGTVAGCYVTKGKIPRSATVYLIRGEQVIFEGKISNLKRYKDDVREASEGFECGISLAGFDDYGEGDVIEAYEIQKIARKL